MSSCRAAAGGHDLLLARVDEVQVHVVARQDARQLDADVPQTEDGDGRDHGERLEEDLHLAAAALTAVLRARPVAERELEPLRGGPARGEQVAGPRGCRGLEVAAADAAPGRVRGDDHLGPGRAGRVPAHRHQGDEYPGSALTPQPVDCREPAGGHRSTSPAWAATSECGRSGWRRSPASGWSGTMPGSALDGAPLLRMPAGRLERPPDRLGGRR